MPFNVASLEYIGGGAVGSLWRYVTTDNLSSANVGDVMDNSGSKPAKTDLNSGHDGYWNNATLVNIRPFDLIFAMNSGSALIGATPNQASPNMSVWVVSGADSNGVSVACASGFINKQEEVVMAFDSASFEYLGGGAVGSIWRYVTTDNLSTANVGDVMNTSGDNVGTQNDGGGYWNDAFPKAHLRTYDLVIAINSSSPNVSFWVVDAADANGVSLSCASGFIDKQ